MAYSNIFSSDLLTLRLSLITLFKCSMQPFYCSYIVMSHFHFSRSYVTYGCVMVDEDVSLLFL